jgi:hypothetical protein
MTDDAGARGVADPAVAALAAAVQANCHIADARHAADLSLCNYLLQMREFYRWEHGLPFGAALPRDEVGAWLAARERLWAEVEGDDFAALPPRAAEPFDTDALADWLAPRGLAYGAGLAGRERPGFFLAELVDAYRLADDDLQVLICGRELARGLFAPPAALIGRTIVLRRESLARWLWQLVESHGLKNADGAMKRVVQAFGLDRDFDAGLPAALDAIGALMLLHERGEHRVGQRLGPAWGELRMAQPDRRTALALSAVRDLLVDLEFTLPTLLDQRADEALHFWFATFDGLRGHLAPGLKAAYAAWCQGDQGQALRRAAEQGQRHFQALAGSLLTLNEDADAVRALFASEDAVFAP